MVSLSRLLLGIIAAVCCSANAQIDQRDSLLFAGSMAIMEQRYADAVEVFRTLTERLPADPSGPVMWAATLYQSSDDLMVSRDDRTIDSLLTLAEVRAVLLSPDDSLDRSGLTFVASGRGIAANIAASRGRIFAAIREAVAASSLSEEILEKDSSEWDAGLALGNYYYWKTRKVELISWLPFIPDSREEGTYLLRRCAMDGRFQRHAAMNSLAWLLIDAGRYSEAEDWLRKGLTEYPDNRSFIRSLALVKEKSGDLVASVALWEEIRRSLNAEEVPPPGALLEACTKTSSILATIGRTEEAWIALEDAILFERDVEGDDFIPRLDRTRDLLRETRRSLENVRQARAQR